MSGSFPVIKLVCSEYDRPLFMDEEKFAFMTKQAQINIISNPVASELILPTDFETAPGRFVSTIA
jgi:hypothetical protein